MGHRRRQWVLLSFILCSFGDPALNLENEIGWWSWYLITLAHICMKILSFSASESREDHQFDYNLGLCKDSVAELTGI